jgi:hypothetical protein
MALDPKKLRDFQQKLEEKTSNTKDWINMKELDGGVEIRILEPLANMNGMYFLEVPIWWINGKKIISPKVFDETDVIVDIIEEAKAQDDPDIHKLLKAVGNTGPKLQLKTEYWIPVLKFAWKFDKNNPDLIVDIFDDKGNPDANLIANFVVDKRPKIVPAGAQLMKAINHEATVRGGHLMVDREKGFNLFLSRTGKGRDTIYKCAKMDYFPMSEKYYGQGNTPDLILIAQAGMYTDEYMESVIANYIYGEQELEKTDSAYRYPDARKELKDWYEDAKTSKKSEEVEEEAKPAAQEPVPGKVPVRGRPAKAMEKQAEQPATVSTSPNGRPRPSTNNPVTAPASRRGVTRRDVAADLQDVKDD